MSKWRNSYKRESTAGVTMTLLSQMPRHLIGDVHEWINAIPIVPTNVVVNQQQRERTLPKQRGKKTLSSLTLCVILWNEIRGVVVDGRIARFDNETPSLLYLFCLKDWKGMRLAESFLRKQIVSLLSHFKCKTSFWFKILRSVFSTSF